MTKTLAGRRRWLVAVAVIGAVLVLGPRPMSQRRNSRRTIVIGGHEAAAGEVIVRLKSGVASSRRLQLEQQIDADESEQVGSAMRRIRSRTFDAETLLAFLAGHPDVEYAEPNYVLHATATPNDTYFTLLWGMHNTGQSILGSPGVSGADIHAAQAWDLSTGSRANVVAVIDTGIDYTHPDLVANVWSAPAAFTVTIGGTAIVCAAGTHGFNAITMSCDPRDDNSHGTHVSGTIGGAGNNAQGVAGVNWTASIMGTKFLAANGFGLVSDAVNAMEFAIQAKAAFASTGGANVRVLSNSWGGGGFSQAMLDEINRANTNDMLFVAAAGNGDANGHGLNNSLTPFYPADYAAPNVIAVAASDNTDHLASFSNYGSLVHLAAPGVNVLSTVIGPSYAYYDGTSMATPHVSGSAALILSECTLSTAALKAVILNNVDVVGALTGWVSTNGRLNVDRAIRACAPSQPPTISTISNVTTGEDIAAHISFTVADPDTPAGNLTVSASSANQTLLPNVNITFSGSGAARTVNLLPAANLSGTASVTVTVSDGRLTASTTFLLTVTPVDDAPTMSVVPDQVTTLGAPAAAIAFTVDDIDSPVAALTLSGSSSDTTLVPNGNIVFGGSGANRTVTITPAAGRSGTATITITVSDGTLSTTGSFALFVAPPARLVLDTFSGADGTQLTAHAPDINRTGHAWTVTGAPAPTLQSGRAAVALGNSGHLQATIDSGTADIQMSTDYRVGTGPGMSALAFRLTDANNFFLLETYAGNLQLYRRQGGTFTLLMSSSIGQLIAGSTHRLEVRAAGSMLQGWWDGVLTVQASDTFQQTATRHGLDWNAAFDATATYDNFFLDDGRPAVAQVAVNPNPLTVLVGGAQSATAIGSDANNAVVPGITYTWTTGDPAKATVVSTGATTATVTGVAAGTTTLTATAPNTVSLTIPVTVTPPPVVAHVSIAPNPVAVMTGGVQTATASASDAGNAPVLGVSYTWTTGDSAIATVVGAGATASITGVAVGATTLTATAPNAVSVAIPVTVTAAPISWLVSDSFTGGDGTLLTAHTPDVNRTGHAWTITGAPAPTLQSGAASVGVGSGHLQATIDSGVADVRMAVDYRVGTGPGLSALAFRLTDVNNFLLLEAYAGSLQLYRRQSGTYMLLASAPIGQLTAGSTHRLEVRTAGSALQGWWDGALTVQATDTFQVTATRHGLDWNAAYDTTTTYDNFLLQDGRPAVAQVAVTPNPLSVLAGSVQSASAAGTDANNVIVPGITYAWATGDATIATVVSTGATTATVAGVAAGTTTLTATAPNTVSVTIPVTVTPPPVVAHVSIAPNPVAVLVAGVQTATASATDTSNVPIAGLTYTWTIGDSAIATVVSTGANTASVTGVATGTTTLTATAPNAVSVAIPVTVTAAPISWLVSDSFTGGDGTLLTAHAPDVNRTGHAWTITGAPAPTLQSGAASVGVGSGHLQATIDSGVADVRMAVDYRVGTGPGLSALAFRLTDVNNFLLLEAYAGSLQLYRRQSGTYMLLASAPIGQPLAGSTHRLEVRAAGSALQGWWDGALTVQATDTFQATATRHGLDWNAAYDTTTTYDNFLLQDGRPAVAQVAVTPNPLSVLAGSVQSASAAGTDANNVIVPGITYAWTTGDATIATVVSTGATTATVTGVAAGTTTLTATAPNTVSVTIPVTVTPPPVVAHVSIAPNPVTVLVAGVQTATASATDASNMLVPGLTYTWTIGDSTIATVVSTGAATASVTGVAAGTTTLTATAPNAVSVTIPVTVTAAPTSWLVSDNFTGIDGTLLTAHAPDVNRTGHAWTIAGAPVPTLQNGAAAGAAGSGHLQATIDSGVADVRMAVDYRVGTGPGLGALAFRLTDANNFLLLETYGGNLQLYRRQSGAYMLLASAPIGQPTAGSTHRLEVRAAGSALQGWWDGVLTVQATDTVQQTATQHGLDWNAAYDTTTTYDNFLLQDGRPIVAQVAVTPNPLSVSAGAAQSAVAVGSDANNVPVTGVTFTWTIADPTTATVVSTAAATATVTGVAVGTTTLTATAPNAVSVTIPVTVTAAAPSNVLVSDSFTGVDGTLLTLHAPDVDVSGQPWTFTGATAPTLQSGRAMVAAGSGHLQATIDTGVSDVQVAADFIAGTGPGLGALAFRLTDANNFLLLETYAGNLQLYRRQAGVFTLLASAPIAQLAAGSVHRLEVRAAGSTLQGWWDGALTVQTTDTFQQAATRHGLDWNNAFDATTTYDNLSIKR